MSTEFGRKAGTAFLYPAAGAKPVGGGAKRQDLRAFARQLTEDVYHQQHRKRIPEYIHPDGVDHSPGAI